ncbi:YqeG family HAD IIIA-type phosphatase [Fervidibacillus halotolerans]|uniref:YqeG family HAD IIIA-type phosphatase n=1 Tax=Fervidibacillus halotolerans TaxID=2980027 RepID=A0A9E8LXL1_9BACI|nr:YqeG family HAD IIIA-type phosphatase [Fervidibacillus halotolerans]WAA11530.1 YqeG family HAD IIIA-type phosphatase [Fervidibacillus halotolerans]
MLKLFLPDDYVNSVHQITPEFLKERNIKGLITDLDNTLAEWDRPLPPPNLIQWFQQMKEAGIQMIIVSNNNEKRVQAFSEPLGIPFISRAKKPLGKSFLSALKLLDGKKEETAVVGDQLLTDILGGNKLGFRTILVTPVADTDGWQTKINRKIEGYILSHFMKKGLLQRGNTESGK